VGAFRHGCRLVFRSVRLLCVRACVCTATVCVSISPVRSLCQSITLIASLPLYEPDSPAASLVPICRVRASLCRSVCLVARVRLSVRPSVAPSVRGTGVDARVVISLNCTPLHSSITLTGRTDRRTDGRLTHCLFSSSIFRQMAVRSRAKAARLG